MKTILHLGDNPISLTFKGFDEEVDVDNLLRIDYSNIYGEATTVSALMNQMGMLKAQCEYSYSKKKLECDVYESERRKTIRGEFTNNGQKLTEKQLDEEIILDKPYQIKKKSVFESKKDLDICDSLFWAVSSKDKKLNNLVRGVTPQELFDELIEGTVNNIVIKKHKSILDK